MKIMCPCAIAASASVVKRRRFRARFAATRSPSPGSKIGISPPVQTRDLGRVDIHADDFVADFGKTGAGDQTNITGAENTDAHQTTFNSPCIRDAL